VLQVRPFDSFLDSDTNSRLGFIYSTCYKSMVVIHSVIMIIITLD